jgi:cytosine/adenosine deaminase-related metal-dependent hydrolase
LILYRAAWVLPISAPPIRNGGVLVRAGRVAAVSATFDDGQLARATAGSRGASEADSRIETIDLGEVAILPGLVNAHTHLELSWMRGRIPPSDSMPAWAVKLMALRREQGSDPPAPIADAIRESRAAGTALVGDVTNTLAACKLLSESRLGGDIFYELLGFNPASPQQLVEAAQSALAQLTAGSRWQRSIVPHAPFSVSPALFRAIGNAADDCPISVHLGESPEEIQFLRDGTGAWRELLRRIGAWTDEWQPPGCGPVEYLDRLGLVNDRLLAVHGTQLQKPELARLAGARATLVACPRSNRWTGAGTPPVERFYESGVRVAIGTDSLASVEDLNVFAELAEMRNLASHVPAAGLLESATLSGAQALGFADEFGSIEPGKRAELIAVRIPQGIDDVEEYLVSGIQPDGIAWLDTA